MKEKTSFAMLWFGVILLVLTACSAEDVAFVQSMAEEWARAKNINPTNNDGSLNPSGLVNAGLSFFGNSGDPDADAAIQAGAVVESIKSADENANKALANQDLKSADDAIKQRPNDFHYHIVRGVILLANGSLADAEWSSADSIAGSQNPKLDSNSLEPILLRDRLNTIEQALASKTLSSSGKQALEKRYCTDAARYYTAAVDNYYVTRARSLGLACGGL